MRLTSINSVKTGRTRTSVATHSMRTLFKRYINTSTTSSSSSSETETEEQHIPLDGLALNDSPEMETDERSNSLLKLVHESKWSTLQQVLVSGKSGYASFHVEACTDTILHDSIYLGAPPHVLMLLASQFPETLSHIDNQKRYPIHAACASGSSPSFIAHCINSCPTSVKAKDKSGKTALHLLCQYYKESNSKNQLPYQNAERNMEQILWIIYRSAPATIIAEDNDGVCAIEYALQSNVSIGFFKTLQTLIVHFNRNNARKIALRKREKDDTKHLPVAFAA